MEKDKTIKIFLASSEELKVDRVAFVNCIRQLDKWTKWRSSGVDVIEWEDYSGAYNGRRKQDEYNDMVRKSDMFLALFFKKAGKYTIEEFDVAIEELHRRQLPKVYVFFKKLKWYQWQTMRLRRFKRRLDAKLGYFWIQYYNQDSLHLKFTQELLKVEEELYRLKLESGTVTLEGIHVAELANLSFAARNKDYKQMEKELEEVLDDIKALEEGREQYPSNTTIQEKLLEKRRRFFQLKKEFKEFQKALFDTAQHIAAMQKEEMDKKMRRATEVFEVGKLEKTNKLIDETIRKAEDNYATGLLDSETIHQGIAALLMKAKTVMAEVSIPISERVEQMQAIYTKADQWAEGSTLLPKEKYDEQLWDYAHFLYQNVKYKEAESVGLRLIALREELFGKEHPSTADAYTMIGVAYNEQGDYAKALEYYGKALDIQERVLGHDHPNSARSYNNIGVVYGKQGNYPKALEYLEKALDIDERVLGPDNPSTATSYGNIGLVYHNQGDYAKALEYHGKALDIQERVLGPDHPNTATSYNNIGLIYNSQGDYAKALEYLGKALDIQERVLGPDHPDSASSYNNIGNVYKDQGDYTKALEYYGKALDIWERKLDPDHPNTAKSYNNIGLIYNSQGDYAKALEFYGKTLDICERVLGPNHPDTAASYNNIGVVYAEQGDYAKALEYFEKTLDIRKRVLGPNHSETKMASENIEKCRRKMQG